MLTRQTMTGPWAGLPVAWTDDDRFDEPAYEADVARCCAAGIPGVYTGGTTGEFYAMEFDEFQAVARATVDECKRHATPAMIGCSSTYTLGAVRRARFAAELGADAIQLAVPFWMQLRDADLVPFFQQVAAAAPGLALSIYETTRSKNQLSADQHRTIHQAVPQYTMVKANAGTVGCTPEGCAALSEFVNVFVGENRWADLGPHGAKGCCSSVVYWNPRVTLDLWRDVERRNWPRVRELTARLNQLFQFLDVRFEPKGFTDTAYDRLGAVAGGFLKTSLRSRGPYPCATAQDVDTLRSFYREHFPEMLEL
jgi:4-hydroxy-tetrahydrodipicolinate synthase